MLKKCKFDCDIYMPLPFAENQRMYLLLIMHSRQANVSSILTARPSPKMDETIDETKEVPKKFKTAETLSSGNILNSLRTEDQQNKETVVNADQELQNESMDVDVVQLTNTQPAVADVIETKCMRLETEPKIALDAVKTVEAESKAVVEAENIHIVSKYHLEMKIKHQSLLRYIFFSVGRTQCCIVFARNGWSNRS